MTDHKKDWKLDYISIQEQGDVPETVVLQEHEFDETGFLPCKNCGLYVEECLEYRYCPGHSFKAPRAATRAYRGITTAAMETTFARRLVKLKWWERIFYKPSISDSGVKGYREETDAELRNRILGKK